MSAVPPVPETDSVVQVLEILRRRWFVLLCAILACVGGAVAYRLTSTERYEASASVVFGAPTLSDAALQVDRSGADPERDAATNVLIAESPEVAEAVRDQLRLREPASTLLNSISVEAEENANVLRIQATSVDPASAARLANAFAGQYIAFKARSEVQSIRAAEEDLNRQLSSLPPEAPERTALQESLQRLTALRAVATGDARVIGTAAVPTEPASLGLAPLVVLAGLIGLAAGLIAVFLLESVDRRINSIEELEREYRLSLLAGVPQAGFRRERADERADGLEPYRILRSALEYSQVARELNVVVVTSAVAGEGKTTVAVDMAHAVALTGRRVVLVELDLRRPTFAQHLGVDSRLGVTTALIHREPLADLLQQSLLKRPNLLVLPSGRLPPNPSELLGSRALTELLEELRADGAMVIIDAPPLIPVADTQVLLNHTVIDGALIVARLGSVTRDEVRRARAILDRHLLQTPGLVVTGLENAERYGYAAYATAEPDAEEIRSMEAGSRLVARRRG
jgi:polysaccharide biosynthesis transport protein